MVGEAREVHLGGLHEALHGFERDVRALLRQFVP
jgi:hypothetical protein